MPLLYASGTVSPFSIIGSGNIVFTHTMTANGRAGVSLVLSNLHSDAATITMKFETLDASNNSYGTITEVFTKPSSSTRLRIEMERMSFLPSGFKARVSLASTGTGNTAISCTWYLFDPNFSSDLSGEALDGIADAVWDESWVDHYEVPDSFAEFLSIILITAGDTLLTAQSVLEDTGDTGVVVAASSKTGYALAANGLSGVTVPAVTLANGAHGGTAASLRLGGSSTTPPLLVENSGGDAVRFKSTGGNGKGAGFIAHGTGHGLYAEAPGAGSGVHAVNLGAGNAVTAAASGVGADIAANLTGNVEGNVTGSAGSVASAIQLPTSADIYHADINYARDNTGSGQDEYTIAWFKNGTWVALPDSGHGSQLRVVKRDGSQLFDKTSGLSVPSGSGIATYDASGSERLDLGMAALVRVKGNVDGAERTYYGIVGRDT